MKRIVFIVIAGLFILSGCSEEEKQLEPKTVITIPLGDENELGITEEGVETILNGVGQGITALSKKAQEVKATKEPKKQLKELYRNAKDINSFEQRQEELTKVIEIAAEIGELKLARRWIDDLDDEHSQDFMSKKINEINLGSTQE